MGRETTSRTVARAVIRCSALWLLPLGGLLLGAPTQAFVGRSFTGRVVGVADGDTITVLEGQTPVKVRLYGVDCPEQAQAFGQQAKQFTSAMVFGKQVAVEVVARDRHGREVARVTTLALRARTTELPDGSEVQRTVFEPDRQLAPELVKAGLAWWYRAYAPKDRQLAALELDARRARRGLWADPQAVAPWDWRRRRRTSRPAPTPIAIGQRNAPPPVASALRGNVRSKVFHRAGCAHHRCDHCTATFASAEQAIDAGYHPHGDCAGRFYLRAQAGHQCLRQPEFRELAQQEQQRLSRLGGARVLQVWASGWWPAAWFPQPCIPARPDVFWPRYPWAGKKVWDAAKQMRCEGCGCFDPWYFCALADAPAAQMKQAGYAPLERRSSPRSAPRGHRSGGRTPRARSAPR